VVAVALLGTALVAAVREPDGPGATLPAASSPAASGVPVLVAARDLPAGASLFSRDVRTVRVPPSLVPAGALGESVRLAGRVVAGPVRRGEPLTDVRFVGPGLAAGLAAPESVAVPVRIADAEVAALVQPGDRVDVLAAGDSPDPVSPPAIGAEEAPNRPPPQPSPAVDPALAPASIVAADVRVLAVIVRRGADPGDGALLVVASSAEGARRLAGAAARGPLAMAVRAR
jgi:Flp pilus assembly protein CpaB